MNQLPNKALEIVCSLSLAAAAHRRRLATTIKPASPDGFVLVSGFHPALMRCGIQARFIDPATGRNVRPASYAHQISDYVMAVVRSGLTFDHISEHAVDEEVVVRSPRAAKYLGWPLLLLMRLRP